MHTGAQPRICRFGPFQLDADRRRLTRGRQLVWLPDRQMDVLLLLTAHAGHVVTKETIVDEAWKGEAISDSSITQAIRGLRRALGSQRGGPYIETHVRKGYRFTAPIEHGQLTQSLAAVDDLLEPYLAFVDGRAALETLDRDAVARARHAFDDVLRAEPGYASAHIGMANACVLGFESTRVDDSPDVEALQQAVRHAVEACRLDPASADAWSALAIVRYRSGQCREAIAAARKAVAMEPRNWQHHLRLAWVGWGEERLRAAHRVLALRPGLALAHWFAATVFVAREAFDRALEELRAGCECQDAQRSEGGRFTALGLHLLHGLVLAAGGATEAALDELHRELTFVDTAAAHVYARECYANSWYSAGALRLRQGRRDDARLAFEQALKHLPGHALATAGLASLSSSLQDVRTHDVVKTVEAAMAQAAVLALQGRHSAAARVCAEALAIAEPGSAGWLLPVEPFLHVTDRRDAWTEALATLRDRAA